MRRLSESLAVQSVDSNSPEPLPTTSTMAQELSAALGMTPVVTSNSLNIASHLLFRQQHQVFICLSFTFGILCVNISNIID